MKTFRRFSLVAIIAAGAVSSQSASAAFEGESIYTEKFLVPAFVPDVRELIVRAAAVRGWRVVEDSPGALTFELRHMKTHVVVIAMASYSKSDFSFHKVSASTFDCDPSPTCKVDPLVVQRWMISLRREAGVALLRAAIADAGGGVGGLPMPAAPVEEPEEQE